MFDVDIQNTEYFMCLINFRPGSISSDLVDRFKNKSQFNLCHIHNVIIYILLFELK